MLKKGFLLFIACSALLLASALNIFAQSGNTDEHKFEAGAQFSLLSVSTVRGSTMTVACLVPPCPEVANIERTRETAAGFGGRIGYNFNNSVAVEAEVNYFPQERRLDGQEIELLAGIKAGQRFDRFGIFGKARPGFISTRVDNFVRNGGACVAVFPPPVGCFNEVRGRETRFALDVGGVIEFYPSKRTIVRFDAGDTISRMGERGILLPSTVFPAGVVVTAPAETTHNLQGSVSIGFRF